MNNRKTNIKRFTKATATLMLCTAALNLTISKAHASENDTPNQAPTSATYQSSSSSAVAPQSNNSPNNGNVVWNGNPDTTSSASSASSSNTTGTATGNDTDSSPSASNNTSSSDTEATSTTNQDSTNTEQSSGNDTPTTNSDSSAPANVAVSFVSNGRIMATAYLPADSGSVSIMSIIPQGYQLQDLSQASIDAKAVNGVANIPIVPTSNQSASSNITNDGQNDPDNQTSSDSNPANPSNPSTNSSNDSNDSNNNSNDTNGTADNNSSDANNPNDSDLHFPPAPKVDTDNQHESTQPRPKRHLQPKANPKKQYKHPVKQPARVLTPSTPKKVNHHRTQHTNIDNPMLRPWHNPDRIKSAKDFRSQVHFNHRDRPKNVHRIKDYRNFDKTVLRYRPMLHKVTKHYHMTKYDDLFMAIMEVESKGNGKDVMQSSESAGLKPNSLDTPQSIEQAVRYMKSITDKAHAMDRVEHQDKRINSDAYHNYAQDYRLLSQAYNYGGGFLDYVAHNKYGYSESMSQDYSKNVVAKQLGNQNGETYRYDKPVAQMYHKNFLYKNGGNFLYADEVSQYLVSGYMKSIMNNLMQYRGTPYVFGGKTPQTNFDCSGLVSYGFKTIGLDGFPDFTETQWNATKPVKDLNHAKPGDLIFFKGTYGDKDFISHVGFLIDKHTMFDSNSSGVEFTDLDQPYWRQHFAGVHRVPHTYQLNRMALQHPGTDYNHTDNDDSPGVAR